MLVSCHCIPVAVYPVLRTPDRGICAIARDVGGPKELLRVWVQLGGHRVSLNPGHQVFLIHLFLVGEAHQPWNLPSETLEGWLLNNPERWSQ